MLSLLSLENTQLTSKQKKRMFTDHPSYKADVQRATDVADIGRLSGKTVLVTGATGLIGVHLIDTLMQLGVRLHFAAGSDKNIKLTTRDDLDLFKGYLAKKDADWMK